MTVIEKLKTIIGEQLGVDPVTVTPESHFQDDLNADPLSIADLVVNIEEQFKLKIPQEELVKFQTVGDIANFLNDNMAEV
jgi:acyl carrier protein